MKRLLFASLLLFSVSAEESSVDERYAIRFTPSLNAQLNLFSDNWDGGDLGSFTWTASTDFSADRQFTPGLRHENWIKLRYGQTALQEVDEDGNKDWGSFQKSTDRIEGETLLRFTLGGFVDPYFSVRGKSQFYDNSVKTNKRRINPVTIKESAGAAKIFTEGDLYRFDGRLGAAARQHIDRDVVKSGDWETTHDLGLDMVLSYSVRREDNLFDYATSFELFQALYRGDHDDLTSREITEYRTPDLRWEHLLRVNVSKVLIFSLGMELLYDREIDSDVRFRENLSAGVSYTFERR